MKIGAPMRTYSKKFALVLLIINLNLFSFSAATDIINASGSISDGETLVSSDGTYELGFFTPGNSRNWYVGLWYRNIPERTYIWVANRRSPLTNTTGAVLQVAEPGILVLVNSSNDVVWSTNTSRSVLNPVAQLLDTGNLVVRDRDDDRPQNFLWQSFDYITDTYWSGVKIGWNLRTGLETSLVSWRTADDPAPGDYKLHLDPTGYPQVFLRRGSDPLQRVGPWNGIRFSGMRADPTYSLSFVMDEREVYYREDARDRSIVSRSIVNQSGMAQRFSWVDGRGWVIYLSGPSGICDTYGLCGPYGRCEIGNTSTCSCLNGFVPRDREAWAMPNWSGGCMRRSNMSCQGDVFLRYSEIVLPDARNTTYNRSMTLDECRAECSRRCSCTAYSQLDLKTGTGCLMWYGDLIDIIGLSYAQGGQDIYIRLASSEAESPGTRNRRILVASLTSGVGFVLIGLSLILLYFWKRNNIAKVVEEGFSNENNDRASELPLFDLSVILKATDNFSLDNKLGEGGFGTVYKGKLDGGQEVAVKRSSKDSMQGLDELKNEVIFIAKLQHRNLVRLLGCCIQGEESLLIYEYMPNKSLDSFLFDETRNNVLDWPKRFHIIEGIARGLLYLHQDSRLRIIHRDLKASNVSLDSDMNPKISDFGMARSFGGNETQAKTRRVVGTYGYMSPEYAIDGLFSVKSDVFSFGVLVLEIVSGKRNRGFSHDDHSLNLLGHAWSLYKEGRSLELADDSIETSFYHSEILRSIHVGLLCVQQNPEDRPIMSSVILMLGNDGLLPDVKQPGFFAQRDILVGEGAKSSDAPNSTNEVTITMPEPR